MSDKSKGKPGRDARGVRINNYNESMRGRQPIQNTEHEAPNVLLDAFRRGFNREITTTDNGDIIEEKRGGGRPRKYPTVESFCDVVNDYINYINDTYNNTGFELIPDIEGFCSFAGIDRSTLYDWETSRSPEYSDVIKELRTAIASYKKQLAMKGKIPPVVFAIDMNNNHDYVQQQKIEVKATSRLEALPSIDAIQRKLPQNE